MKFSLLHPNDFRIASLPSWERGLKYVLVSTDKRTVFVAPLVGAWIEIPIPEGCILPAVVAPLVGAWIEIAYLLSRSDLLMVAPLVGAWIEMHSGHP